MQQIIVSGLGGQGVLFVTKLLAETALDMEYSALLSETHGMAQRGGNVISHLKIWRKDAGAGAGYTSPLVRPGMADVLISLHPDAILAHGHFLKPGGIAFCNDPQAEAACALDATAIACELGTPVSANLVLLGFAAGSGGLFCSPEHLEATLKRIGGKRLEASLQAFKAGCAEAAKRA